MAEQMSASEAESEGYTVSDMSSAPSSNGSQHHSEGPESEQERACWICFATEKDNSLAAWVQPCQCRGTTKWVHQSCLYRWIDEKQKGNTHRSVICQQCQTEYIIVFPKMSRLAMLLESVERLVKYSSPYVAAGVVVGSFYWTAITYGAITVIQVMGQQRGLALMEKGDPFFLLIGLPFIPVALILTRLVRWEDAVLRIIRGRHTFMRKFPLLNWMFSSETEPDVPDVGSNASNAQPPAAAERMYVSRLFCGAVLLPSISTLVGNIVFKHMQEPLHRTLLGGATYIGVKGILKIYLRQKQYLRRKRRRIVDYTEENIRTFISSPPLSNNNNNNGNNGTRQGGGFDDFDYEEAYNDDDDDEVPAEPNVFAEEDTEFAPFLPISADPLEPLCYEGDPDFHEIEHNPPN